MSITIGCEPCLWRAKKRIQKVITHRYGIQTSVRSTETMKAAFDVRSKKVRKDISDY
jgi:hypothetical protein